MLGSYFGMTECIGLGDLSRGRTFECCFVRKEPSKLPETAAVSFIREESLLRYGACNDHRGWEVLGAGTGGIHAPESLLEGLEGTGNGSGTKIHILGIGLDLGHETQLVDIQVSQTLA